MADISKITIESGTYDVKDDICRNDTNFYDEVTYTKNRGYNTDYFLTYIPFEDNDGNQIPFKVAKIASGETPNSHAINNVTNFTCNATLSLENTDNHNFYDGIVIGDGVVLNDYDVSSLGTDEVYLTFDENRDYTLYPRNTTSSTMLANGVKNAFLIFGQCVTNGVLDENFTHQLKPGPDIFIGMKLNKDIVIISCNGRNSHNLGLDYQKASSILISQGCVNVFALDGGGSTSTSFRCMKLNNNVDNNGLDDRKIHYVIDVKKPMQIKSTSQIYSNLGKIKQIVSNDTQGLLNNKENRHQVTRKYVQQQTITPNNQLGEVYYNYGGSIPTNSLINFNNGVITFNTPDQHISVVPFYLKIGGNICVYNNMNVNTLVELFITINDSPVNSSIIEVPKKSYGTFFLNNYISVNNKDNQFKIMINASDTTDTIIVQDRGEVHFEYIPNDNTFIS